MIEHDALTCHILTGAPAEELRSSYLQSPVIQRLNDHGIIFQIFDLHGWSDLSTVLATASDRGKVVAIGLGCSSGGLEAAIKKAVTESLPNSVFYLMTGKSHDSQIEVWLNTRLRGSLSQRRPSKSILVDSTRIQSPISNPFVTVKSSSSELQAYLPDGWTAKNFNQDRLRRFADVSSLSSLREGERLF
ncbi:MAG: hypothetical protein AB7G93_11965 [Bdellovibrionales bacterium]